MPAPPLANTFEGGSDGTTITTLNSGGSSGDAFSSVNGTSTKFSATNPYFSTLSLGIVDAASTARVRYESLGSITTSVYIRSYIRMSAIPAANDAMVVSFLDSTLTEMVSFRMSITTGFMRARNAAGVTYTGTIGAVQFPTSAYSRFEARVLASTTVGEIEWKWWASAQSTGTPDDTKLATGLAMTFGNIDAVGFGLMGSLPTTPYNVYHDNVAVASDTWIGPSAIAATPGLALRDDVNRSLGPF